MSDPPGPGGLPDEASHLEFEHPRKVLDRLGIAARKSMSQNFLCQPALARSIAEMAFWDPACEAVEVGGGTGVLTDAIVERHRDLLVVELDRTLAEHLRQRYRGRGVTVMEADARTVDLALVRHPPVGVYGNLPYAVTTELLLWLIRQRAMLAGAVIMVQKEYADRLGARPRTKAYSSLSVFAALHMEIVSRRQVGPGVFHPPPQVGSTVVALRFREPPREVDGEFLERVVRGAFAHRRKMARSNLATALGRPVEEMAAALSEVAGSPDVRAEELDPPQFVALAHRLNKSV
jgi:16S rRNA (adenine1518-N6/adenine1519-N6)-dimethyltransferase